METGILDAVLSDQPIERIIILLLAAAVIALTGARTTSPISASPTSRRRWRQPMPRCRKPRRRSTCSQRGSRTVARLIDLLILGRGGEALDEARQESERRLAELRAQSRRLRRAIQKLHDEDRRREQS